MGRLFTAIVFLGLVFIIAAPASADATADKRDAANRYLDAVDFAATMDQVNGQMMAQIAAQLPPENRAEFNALMRDALSTEWLEGMMMSMLVESFTLEELNALADFYGSPVGKSINAKLPALTNEAMQAGQQRMLEVLQSQLYR